MKMHTLKKAYVTFFSTPNPFALTNKICLNPNAHLSHLNVWLLSVFGVHVNMTLSKQ